METVQAMRVIWEALWDYQETSLHTECDENNRQWDSICEAMASLGEALGIPHDAI